MRVRDREVILLPLTPDGRLVDSAALEVFRVRLPNATDCFVFCHGWLYDRAEAREEAARFFALLDTALRPLGDRVAPLRLAVHWPSKLFAGSAPGRRTTPTSGSWSERRRPAPSTPSGGSPMGRGFVSPPNTLPRGAVRG